MADAPVLTENVLYTRTRAIVSKITVSGDNPWRGLLPDSRGSTMAAWAYASALAPFYPEPPTFSMDSSMADLDHVWLEFDHLHPRLGHGKLHVCIRYTRDHPHRAMVYVEFVPYGTPEGGTVRQSCDCTVVDTASPFGLTIYRESQAGCTDPYPQTVPIMVTGDPLEAAVKAGELLAMRLQMRRAYGLTPRLPEPAA